MDSKQLEQFKAMLQSALCDVLGRGDDTLQRLGENTGSEVDPVDKALAESERAFSLLLRGREQRLIRKIEKALERIEQGEYGVCEECGGEIRLARLQARPVTTLCIECKALQEYGETDVHDSGRDSSVYRYVQHDPRNSR